MKYYYIIGNLIRIFHLLLPYLITTTLICGKKSICKEVELLYRNFSSCLTKKYINVDMETASLIKYSINSFLATKVLFFNILKRSLKYYIKL